MRWLLLVLASGCASDAWRGDFDGDFLVTSYTSDVDTCEPSTKLAAPESYFRFLMGRASHSVQWCDANHVCSPYDRWRLEVDGDKLVSLEPFAISLDSAPPQGVVCLLQYFETRATRTASDEARVESRTYRLEVPYDASCTAARATEALAAGACSFATTLTGRLVRPRS